MNVVILGSNSFLAGYIIRELTGRGIRPVLFGLEPDPSHAGLEFRFFSLPGVPPDLAVLSRADLVVYTAGAGIQPGHRDAAGMIFELNAFFPIRMLNYLAESGFSGSVVTFGSYFEIGRDEEGRYHSEMEVTTSGCPVTGHYAVSKRLLTRFLASESGLPGHYHFILPNLYGPGENPSRLIPHLIAGFRSEGEIGLTGGSQVRMFIHATDVARAVTHITRQPVPPGMYNLCERHPWSVQEVATMVAEEMGETGSLSRIRFGTLSRNDASNPFLLLNDAKTRQVMKFEPQISIREGIRTYLSPPDDKHLTHPR